MNFSKTTDSIKALETAEKITVRDIIGLFAKDICGDLKSAHYELEQLDLGNCSEAIPWLGKMARLINKIYANNAQYFNSDEFRDLWTGIGKKIADTTGKIEEMEMLISASEKDICRLREEEGKLREYSAELGRLDEAKRALYESISEKKELKQKVEEIEFQINDVKNVDLPEAVKEKNEAEERLERAKAEINEIAGAVNERREGLKELRSEKQQLEAEISGINRELQDEKANIGSLQAEITNSLGELKAIRETEIPAAADEVKRIRETDIPAAFAELNHIREVDRAAALEELAKIKETDIPAALEELDNIKRVKIADAADRKAEIDKAIGTANAVLDGLNLEIKEKKAEKFRQEEEVGAMDAAIAAIGKEIKALAEETSKKKSEIDALTAEKEKTRAALQNTENQYRNMYLINDEIEKKYEEYKKTNKENIAIIEKKLRMLRELASNWEKSADVVALWSDKKVVDNLFSQLKTKLNNLKAEAEASEKEYEKMLRVFEKGEY